MPLGAYLLLLGLLNLRRRPTVVTGFADTAALGAALTGVALVGPISLFRPEAATAELGPWVWALLLAFYWLWVALLVMLGRPRLVVYNTTPSELRPAVSEALRQLDPAARWAGGALAAPTLGVQLHLDAFPWMRNTTLVASGGEQDLGGWTRLGRATALAARSMRSPPNPRAIGLLTAGGLIVLAAIARLVSDPPAVAVAWRQFFEL